MLPAIAVFAPLLGAAVAGLLGWAIGDRPSQVITILCMIVAAIAGVSNAVLLISGASGASVIPILTWITAGSLSVSWALKVDTLSAVMLAMVTTVSMLIHVYSVGYMAHEKKRTARFFCYLSLFTFAMLMLVSADNILQLFFGWEGVGLMSYLLIGYWYERPSACAAAIKAFVVNRVADLFFAVGIALLFSTFGSLSFADIFAAVPQHVNDHYTLFGTSFPVLEVLGVLLFIGAMGKSAQLFLHTWLPDAMEGPTPVSALIHAATMVTAGVFLMARMSPLMEYAPGALGLVTFIGGSTALFAGTIGCVQNDIKKVIAYSTCSQLGYMFLAAGVSAFPVAIFHLITHAFFKSLLFLGAGSVIHAMSDEQDMRRMGGLWRKIPITYAVMWIGFLALSGIPPFAGYYSKDAILDAAATAGSGLAQYGYICGVAAAFLTAFYSFRVLFMTFHGRPRADQHVLAHVHESPPVMTVPLILLAIGATIAGFALRGLFIGHDWQGFWGSSIFTLAGTNPIARMETLSAWLHPLPLIVGLLGIATAYLFYIVRPEIPVWLAEQFRPVYLFLLNKWYFDELYDMVFVRPTMRLARLLWQVGDATVIDGVPNGIAVLATDSSAEAVKLQSGSVAQYAFAMVIGVVVLIAIFLLVG
ncbi:MAG TPA: NADH-quinone oxidoreductase subunit L [Acetobacteraceae bacterium]|jgi:NADH-quinone oxidoreductase subunit L|nr:NADH-quinone oxidoreductase subunit L [Acetobacteraceae bacterium]